MKKSYLFLFFSFLSVVAGAQTLVDPLTVGGFESGTTFAANGWTAVNPSTAPLNQWIVGTGAPQYGGSRGAYISNSGTVYAYTTTTARTSHVYRDIPIPAGPGSVTVDFYWKGSGELGKDQLLVYTAPTTTVPVANEPVSPATTAISLAGATLRWSQPSISSTYSFGTFSFLTGATPTTIRLIFTWQNDAAGGVSPGAAIDNIGVSFVCNPPAAILGANNVCVNDTMTLTNATAAGTWSSGDVSKATISSAGLVTGINAGTVNITYTSACGVPTSTMITVNPLPPAITGPSTVCAGSSITLSNTTSGGTWAGGTNATATTLGPNDGLITGTAGGTSLVTYTSPLGCKVTKTITVNSLTPIAGLLKQCYGGTSILSHSIPGGTWTSSNPTVATIGSSSGLVTTGGLGMVGGTTIISYTNVCGTVTAVDTVIELTTPIVGNDTVCQGGTTAFAHVVLGGSWSSQYPLVASVLSGSGLVTGVNPGITRITYTVPPGCYVTTTVEVVPGPPAITGSFNACVGSTTLLSNASGGGTWSSSSSATATVGSSTGVVTGVSANTATITYTALSGCLATEIVTINPIPLPIEGIVNKCPANPDTLFNPSPGGTWSSLQPGVATIGATSGILTTVSGGNATIRYTFPGTGCFVSKNITVYPAPAPIIKYDAVNVTFYTDTTFVTYQWYDSLQGLIPGATTYKTAAKYLGDYYVVVTDTNDCSGQSNKIKFTKWVGISETENGLPHIYPNPTTGIVYLQSGRKFRIEVAGVEGKVLLEKADAREINISNLPSGVYLLSAYDENGIKVTVQKIVKQQ
jgi:uncharacterized protein YjdB